MYVSPRAAQPRSCAIDLATRPDPDRRLLVDREALKNQRDRASGMITSSKQYKGITVYCRAASDRRDAEFTATSFATSCNPAAQPTNPIRERRMSAMAKAGAGPGSVRGQLARGSRRPERATLGSRHASKTFPVGAFAVLFWVYGHRGSRDDSARSARTVARTSARTQHEPTGSGTGQARRGRAFAGARQVQGHAAVAPRHPARHRRRNDRRPQSPATHSVIVTRRSEAVVDGRAGSTVIVHRGGSALGAIGRLEGGRCSRIGSGSSTIVFEAVRATGVGERDSEYVQAGRLRRERADVSQGSWRILCRK